MWSSPTSPSTRFQAVADESMEAAWANKLLDSLPSAGKKRYGRTVFASGPKHGRLSSTVTVTPSTDIHDRNDRTVRRLPVDHNRRPSKSLVPFQSIESFASSAGPRASSKMREQLRKTSIESASSNNEAAVVQDVTESEATSRAPTKNAPCCLSFLARKTGVPLECLQAASELFSQFAELPAHTKDGDILTSGLLNVDSLTQVVCHLTGVEKRDLPEALVCEVKAEADRNEDGVVDFKEFAHWYQRRAFMTYVTLTPEAMKTRLVSQSLGISSVDMDRYEKLFRKFDLNGNGTIDKAEFGKLINALMRVPSDMTVPSDRVTHFWHECDQDGDGRVDFEEFVMFYINHFDSSSEDPMSDFYKSIRRVFD